MILDTFFEIPKLEDPILNFQILFGIRNTELKISQHISRTCLWFVTLKVEDAALISDRAKAFYKKEIIHLHCVASRMKVSNYADSDD